MNVLNLDQPEQPPPRRRSEGGTVIIPFLTGSFRAGVGGQTDTIYLNGNYFFLASKDLSLS